MLLVGAGDGAELFIRAAMHSKIQLYRPIGMVSENTGRVGRDIHGLAVLGTVAWTTVANSVRTQVGHASAAPPPASIYNHALTVGFSRAFLVAAGIGLVALIIAIATIRVSRQELTGVVPAPQEGAEPAPPEGAEPAPPEGAEPAPHETVPQPAAPQPGTEQRPEDRAALAAAARPCRLC